MSYHQTGLPRKSRQSEIEAVMSYRNGKKDERPWSRKVILFLFVPTLFSLLHLMEVRKNSINFYSTADILNNATTVDYEYRHMQKLVQTRIQDFLATKTTKPAIIICGVVRNVKGSHLRHQIPKLARLGKALSGDDNFHILVYENDSDPGTDTRKTLQELLDDKPYGTFVFEDKVTHGLNRVDRIARARNKVMEVVEERFATDYDYLIMTDMDAVCGGSESRSFDPEVFQYALNHSNEWDAVSFRKFPYWDLWALRHPEWMPENMFHRARRGANKVKKPKDMHRILDQYPRKQFIPVTSAFMMISLYKIKAILGGRYSGTGIHGEMDCEHVAFHRSIAEKNQARIRMLPLAYCTGDTGHYPLKEQLAM